MKYLYLFFSLFLFGCNETVQYRGSECEVPPNDTGYTNELKRVTKEIRENVLSTYSQKGVVQSRNDNEDMDDEIEAMSDLIQSQTREVKNVLIQKYCKEVDQYYNLETQEFFTTNNIKDTLYLKYLNGIKLRQFQEKGM